MIHSLARSVLLAAGLSAMLASCDEATDSVPETCGDGWLDVGEECDDGSRHADDGCRSDCTVEDWIMEICSTGLDGDLVAYEDTVINTYYAAPAEESTLMAGTTELTLGAARGAMHKTVRVGDRLMIIQMQGTQIDAAPGWETGSAYGDGVDGLDRSGYTMDTLTAGTHEIVVVVAVPTDGPLSIRGQGADGGLLHSYTNSRMVTTSPAWESMGFQTYQVIWIPQFHELTVADTGRILASEWNGDSGGIVVIDVLATLTVEGSIDVSGLGFRGGMATSTNDNNPGNSSTPGFKGEGIAGTPARMYVSATDTFSVAGRSGYPAPDQRCVGAPGNAGGNARDAFDAGGGGGGNGGRGGNGGEGGELGHAGRGGAKLPSNAAILTLGGGGGGANGDDPIEDLAECSGQSGGGAIVIRAAAVLTDTGQGVVRADGAGGLTSSQEGGGGGGGGGMIVMYTDDADLTGLTISAGGGDGNSVRENNNGAGGGGGGGRVYIIDSRLERANVLGGGGGYGRAPESNGAAGVTGPLDLSAQAPDSLRCEFVGDRDSDGFHDRIDPYDSSALTGGACSTSARPSMWSLLVLLLVGLARWTHVLRQHGTGPSQARSVGAGAFPSELRPSISDCLHHKAMLRARAIASPQTSAERGKAPAPTDRSTRLEA